MKTITLDDEAYLRLKNWKQNSRESFSQVIKRVLPEAGSVSAFLHFVEANRTDQLPGNDLMEDSISQAFALHHDRPLISRNQRHFRVIPNLRLEALDWGPHGDRTPPGVRGFGVPAETNEPRPHVRTFASIRARSPTPS